MEVISGIYSITNEVNNKVYIGSSKNIFNRKSQHYSELRGNYHANRFLQRAWNKYGEHSFKFEIVEVVKDIDMLLEVEQKYLDSLYDEGLNCYNLNPKADKPPKGIHKPCALYSLNGEYIKKFDSIRDCSIYVGVNEGTIKGAISRKNSSVDGKYMVRLIEDESRFKDNIPRFIPYNETTVYILDDEDNIKHIFSKIEDVCKHIEGYIDREACSVITNSLTMIHKYKGIKVIYKEDFEKFGNSYPNFKLRTYKYIAKYSFKGELLEIIENKYGMKFTGGKADNCKINTRIRVLCRDIPFRVYSNEFIYLRSDFCIPKIKTNISTYMIEDLSDNTAKEFLKQKNLINYLGIKKSTFEYYLNNAILYKERYKFKKIVY